MLNHSLKSINVTQFVFLIFACYSIRFYITLVSSVCFSSFSLILFKNILRTKFYFFPFNLKRKHWVNFFPVRGEPQRPFKMEPIDLLLVLGNKWGGFLCDWRNNDRSTCPWIFFCHFSVMSKMILFTNS